MAFTYIINAPPTPPGSGGGGGGGGGSLGMSLLLALLLARLVAVSRRFSALKSPGRPALAAPAQVLTQNL